MSPEAIDISPDLETPTPDSIETDPIDSGTDATADEPSTDDEPAPTDPAAPTVNDGHAISDGRLSTSAKTALTELAKSSPKLAKSIRSALFEADALRREVPGGLKEIAAIREQLEQHGGTEAIARTKQELDYFNDLDQQFTAGDPRFLQAMIDTPEGQQGFLKLAPAMIGKFRELAPEMHDSYVAKQQFEGMNNADLKFSIVRMKDAIDRLPDGPEKSLAMEQWVPLASYYNSVADAANRKVEAPKETARPQQAPDERAQLDQERQQFTMKQWTSEASSSAKSMIDSEVAKLVADRKLSATQKGALMELGVSRLKAALGRNPDFNKVSQRHFANKDQSGFLRHVNSEYRKHIPAVFRAAADAIQSAKTGGKPAATAGAAAPKNGTTPAATTPAATGFGWVATVPKSNDIDFTKTDRGMIRLGKAVLANGKRVQWKVN